MVANAGDEFRATATPTAEVLRRLAYLAEIGSPAVIARGFTVRAAFRTADNGRDSLLTEAMVRMARLADPAYQEMATRITGKLTRMDEASVAALQEIEQEMQELARERERLRERAFRDEQGRRIYMTEDGSAAFYENGNRVADEEFAIHRERLRGRPTWEEWERRRRQEADLRTERDQIHTHDADRNRLRDDLAEGRIPKEEAEQRERVIEESMPARMRRVYAPAAAVSAPELQAGAPGEDHPAPHLLPPQL